MSTSSTDRVVELRGLVNVENPAEWVSNLWTTYNHQMSDKINDWAETDKYLFATDTQTTSNKRLKWTHTTTTPKLTNIRDNLHANYLSSLFPNDKWLTWNAYSKEAADREVAETITAYMDNKTREGGFRDTVSRLLYDYIDKGVCFSMPSFEHRYNVLPTETVKGFVGPKAVRISPFDIRFNPTAVSFATTPKIIRSTTTLGAIRKLMDTNPMDGADWEKLLNRRQAMHGAAKEFSREEWAKIDQYCVDGFGSMQEYYKTDIVEILEFYGDYHDSHTGEIRTNRMITVVDRAVVVRDIPTPTYSGEAPIRMAGWRSRPDNLWPMGPLDNLVGMQYMIDHYMNMASNALDLKVMPPKKIIGDVESFNWEPNAEIHLDENGDVQEMAQQYGDIHAIYETVSQLEARMELYAGAPREAMGIRTPGEKTAFEVQALENAAGRIFQEKIVQFELFMEQLLNDMLETAHRNMEITDIISVIDNDIGVQQFKSVTKEQLTADGVLRPVGARHFSQRAQELQNLVGVFSSPIANMIAPHTSGIGLTHFIKDVVDLRGYEVFSPNIAVMESADTQMIAGQAEESNISASSISEEELMMEDELAQEVPE